MSVSFDSSRVTLVDHPLVQHKLTIMRDERTGSKQFRELVKELALFEGYEATRDFPLEDAPVKTPICAAAGHADRWAQGCHCSDPACRIGHGGRPT